MKLLLIYCLFLGLTVVLGCIHLENFECFCSANEIECAGSGDNTVEMPHLLSNISSSILPSKYLESLVLNMTNLTLPNELSHIDLKIRNLSLFNVLLDSEEDSLKGIWASLKFLKIQNCNLEFVGKLFNNLHNLTELNLDYNKISELKFDDFLNLSKLEHLSITENQLSALEDGLIVGLPVLQTLSVNGNHFSFFSNVNITSLSLKKLSIQNCHIKGSLEENTLVGVPNVLHLDLSCNQLETISTHALSSLTDIKVLNLSKNVIHHLKGNAFSKMFNLETLDLSQNRIKAIILDAFLNLKHLENLNLSFNMINAMFCIYTYDMQSLKIMDLRHNSIRNIEYGTFLNNRKLEELFLEGNAFNDAEAVICSPLMSMNISFVDINFQSKDCDNSTLCGTLIRYNEDSQTEDYEYKEEDEAENNEYHNVTSSTSSYDFKEDAFTYSVVYNDTISLTDFVSTTMKDETTMIYDMDSSYQIVFSQFLTSTTTDNNASIDLFSTTELSSLILENITPTVPLNYSNADTLKTSEIIDYDINSSSEKTASTYLIETIVIESDISANIFSSINQNISLTDYIAIHSSLSLEDFDDSIISTPSIQVDNTVYNTKDSNIEDSSSISSLLSTNYMDAAVYHSSISIFLNDSFKLPSETQTLEVMYNDTENSNFANSLYVTKMITMESITVSSLYSVTEPIATSIPWIDLTSTISKMVNSSLTYSKPITKKPVSTKPKVTFLDYTYINDILCLKWKLTLPEDILLEKVRCTLSSETSNKTTKIHNSKTLTCPKSGIITQDCVTVSRMEKFCLIVHSSEGSLKKVCSKRHSPKLTTTNISSDFSVTSSTASILKSTLNVDTTLTNDTITTSSGDEVRIVSSTASTSIPEIKHSLNATITTNYIPFSISIPDKKYSPTVPTSSPEMKHSTITVYSDIPFSLTLFEVIFNDSNSAFVVWSVSKYESMSQCNLTLTLFHENSVYTEIVFKCINNSHLIKNLKEMSSYKICLKSHHIKYGIENRCKWNSDPLYNFNTLKRKDHGYKNSSLFAVSILLLVVLVLIIGIVLRNLFKKRFIKDRYNVYIEEQNVQKRYSSIHQEPNVRYSSTPKE